MCRISVVDQSRVLWMRKQGAPWGTLQKWSDCRPNIFRGGGVQTTTEKRRPSLGELSKD